MKKIYRCIPIIRELVGMRERCEIANEHLSALRSIWANASLERLRKEKVAAEGPECLHGFEWRVCSQNGEDGVISELLRRFGVVNRRFVEIGVGANGQCNTNLLASLGWSGVWIDGNPELRRGAGSRRETGVRVKLVVSEVRPDNVNDLLVQAGAEGEIDVFSLDIDQNTYHVWKALEVLRPRMVVIEYNGLFPPEISWIAQYERGRTWSGDINFGASLAALEALGRRKGYTLVHCETLGVNAFFVRSDLVQSSGGGPALVARHFEPLRYDLVFGGGHRTAFLDESDHE